MNTDEEAKEYLEYAVSMRAMRGRPLGEFDGSVATALQYQQSLWWNYFGMEDPKLPKTWTRARDFLGSDGVLEGILKEKWYVESAYILHDVVCRMAEEFPDYWDDDLYPVAMSGWLMENAYRHQELPSDVMRDVYKRKLKHPNQEWAVQRQEERPQNLEWVSRRGPQSTRRSSHGGTTVLRGKLLNQENLLIPRPVSRHLNEVTFFGIRSAVVDKEMKLWKFWDMEGVKFKDY